MKIALVIFDDFTEVRKSVLASIAPVGEEQGYEDCVEAALRASGTFNKQKAAMAVR